MKRRAANFNHAFTLLEALVVTFVLMLIAIIFFLRVQPAHVGGGASCFSNLRQMSIGWVMYCSDYNNNLPCSAGLVNLRTNAWAYGNAQTLPQDTDRYGQFEPGILDATNLDAIQRGSMFPYMRNPALYRCVLDGRTVDGVPYVRSYSMNNWMNGQSPAAWMPGLNTSNRVYQKSSDLPAPAHLFVFMDEDLASVNDTMFVVAPDAGTGMNSIPTRIHLGAYVLGFADGHVEVQKILCRDTLAWNPSKPHPPEICSDGTTNEDLIKLRSEAYLPW